MTQTSFVILSYCLCALTYIYPRDGQPRFLCAFLLTVTPSYRCRTESLRPMSFTVNNFAADGSFSLDASPCRISQDLALRICRQRRIVAPSHGLTATVSSAMSNYALTTVETFAVDPDLSGCDIVLGPSWSAKCVERGLPNVVLNIPTYGGSALGLSPILCCL